LISYNALHFYFSVDNGGLCGVSVQEIDGPSASARHQGNCMREGSI